MRSRRKVTLAVSTLAAAATLVPAVGQDVALAAPSPSGVSMTFDRLPDETTASGVLWSDSSWGVDVNSSVSGGGSMEAVAGPEGRAIRFPAASSDSLPRAVVTLTRSPSSPTDTLNPKLRDFSFGADFRLDAVSEGLQDNGDNIVQRGRFSGLGQYKLQVDHHVLSCRIKGVDGAVMVKMPLRVAPTIWYRASCLRAGRTVTLKLRKLDGSVARSVSRTGPLGSVNVATYPFSVGGKVYRTGQVVPHDADQFNGLMDQVEFTLVP